MSHSQAIATSDQPRRPSPPVIGLLTAALLAYRGLAMASPSTFVEIEPPLFVPMNVLGALFLMCGLWAWWVAPSGSTPSFLAYAFCGCLHWGGAIGAESESMAKALLAFYVAATAAGDGAFLDLAIRFPPTGRAKWRRSFVCYLPAMISALMIPLSPVLADGVSVGVFGIVLTISSSMTIAGGVVFVAKWLMALLNGAPRHSLGFVAGACVVSFAASTGGQLGILPGAAAGWNLANVLVPIALVRSLAAIETRTASTPGR